MQVKHLLTPYQLHCSLISAVCHQEHVVRINLLTQLILLCNFAIMKFNRITLHLLFWLAYFTVSLYNELYISESFSLEPSWKMFFESTGALFLITSVKIAVVYIILYWFIPKWVKSPGKLIILLPGIAIIFLGAFIIRIIMHFIVWPFLYDVSVQLSFLRILARYFYSLLDLLQIVGIAAAIKLYRMRIKSIKDEKKLMQEKLNAEMLHLKSQINPHFLFNSLNSIYALAYSKSDLTADALMKLSKILRYVIYDAGSKTNSVADELKIIDDYVHLQQLRFAGRIKLNFVTEVDNTEEQVASLILLPLIENAYKHSNGLETTIDFNLKIKQGILNLVLSNPVVEESVKQNKKEGVGLKNIKRQLELLYKNYNLDYITLNENFVLTLMIDLRSNATAELFDN